MLSDYDSRQRISRNLVLWHGHALAFSMVGMVFETRTCVYIGRGLTIRLWATGSLSEMLRVGHGRLAGNVHRGGT